MTKMSGGAGGAGAGAGKKEDHKCQWTRCKQSQFKTVEKLLEHVNERHIPTRQKSQDGQEEVVCKWAGCGMSTTRGDLKKKTEWMQCHFKTRHARSAKLFKCLFDGCEALKATSQELESHVRLHHSMKPKREKKRSPTPEPEPTNQIYEIHGLGRVSWKPAPIVTKPTIVEYSDGPRYVFPPGYLQCDLDSDGEPLADDEYWQPVYYFDENPSPLIPSTSKHPFHTLHLRPPAIDRPTRIRRKMTEEMIKERDAKRRKEAGLPPIDAVYIRMPWREEKELERKKSPAPIKPLTRKEKEISPPPDFVIEEPDASGGTDSDEMMMPVLKPHYEDSEKEEFGAVVAEKVVVKRQKRSPKKTWKTRKSMTPQKMDSETTPTKKSVQRRLVPPPTSLEDSEANTDSDSDSESEANNVKTPRKRKILKKKESPRKIYPKSDSEDTDSESEGVTPPPASPRIMEDFKASQKLQTLQKSPESKKPDSESPGPSTPAQRPRRSCKMNVSLSEQDAELVWKCILESPMKENLNSTIANKISKKIPEKKVVPESRSSPRKSSKDSDVTKTQILDSEGAGPSGTPLGPSSSVSAPQKPILKRKSPSEILKNLKKRLLDSEVAGSSSETSSKSQKPSLKRRKPSESPSNPKKRPSRACRALGSMEEVPFDVEIELEEKAPREMVKV